MYLSCCFRKSILKLKREFFRNENNAVALSREAISAEVLKTSNPFSS
jgi:hypothetical protein